MIEIPFYIPRTRYVEKIRPFFGSRIIKVLTGQRRTGKSYLLYQLMDEIRKQDEKANILYINTEFAEWRQVAKAEDLYGHVRAKQGRGKHNYLFIDEIQEIERFEEAVKSIFAEGRWDIYITGSNARLLSGELATYLAGRYIQFQVHPLGYREFLEFYQFRNTTGNVKKYLLIGGMPYLASLPEVTENAVLAQEYLRNVYESILLRDVVVREKIRNVRFLENLASYLADNVGNLFSANSISKYLKNQRINMPVQTVISYLKALENSFFITKLECRNVKGLKIFEIGEKYYFEDLGLRNIISREGAENEMQKLVENSVYLFLVQSGFAVSGGRVREKEIDFVAEKDRKRIYVQACYRISGGAVEEREFGNLQVIDDHFPKYVVTLDDEYPAVNRKGIEHRKLKDFLTMEL